MNIKEEKKNFFMHANNIIELLKNIWSVEIFYDIHDSKKMK